MRTDPRADEVRRIVERVFSGYRAESRRPWGKNRLAGRFPRLFEPRLSQPADEDCGQDRLPIEETILIDEGRYVARSYRMDGYMAMWLVPVGIVQFYDDRGR